MSADGSSRLGLVPWDFLSLMTLCFTGNIRTFPGGLRIYTGEVLDVRCYRLFHKFGKISLATSAAGRKKDA